MSIPDSIKAIVPDCRQAVVYGWNHCKYDQFFKNNPPGDDALKGILGPRSVLERPGKTIEERIFPHQEIPLLLSKRSNTLRSNCKRVISVVILENYKRSQEGLPLIPIIFCTAIQDSSGKKWKSDTHLWTTKKVPENRRYTPGEMRRCHKIRNEFNHNGIREIARQTFKFVEVICDQNGDVEKLIEIPAPWEAPDWEESWAARKKLSGPQQRGWREDLMKAVRKIDDARILSSSQQSLSIS